MTDGTLIPSPGGDPAGGGAPTPPGLASPPAPAAAGAPVKAEMPAGFPSQFWDAEKGAPKIDDFAKDYTRLAKESTDRAAALSTLPTKPEAYPLELPKDFKLPDGVQVKFDPKDPLVIEAQKFAHANKIDPATFSGMLALRAQMIAKEHADALAYVATEKAKLGDRGPDRIEAIKSWMGTNLTAAQAAALGESMTSADAFEAIESLIVRAQGGIPNTDARPAAQSQPSQTARWYPDMVQQKAS